ncbi:MAG: hypothetical protein RIS29_3123 [Bacteroidota bacterium]|jgi:hypothetical protein
MKKILFTVTLLLVALALPAQELLVNGGFENWTAGKPNGWNVTNTINIVQNALNFNEGATSAKVINATTGNFNINQSIAVTPGKTYSVSLSYYIQQGDGTDARLNCYFRDASNKAIKWSLADSLAMKGPGGNGSYFPNVLNAWKTYSYDVVAPANASTFMFYVVTGSYATVSWDNFSFKLNSTPTVYSSANALSGFIYAPGKGPSSEQSFTVRANNISGALTIAAPADYEISVGSGSSFIGTNTISIPSTNGSVAHTTIYARLKAGLGIGSYNETLTVSANGAASQNVTLSGAVSTLAPVITVSTTSLSGFNYVESQGPSAQKSFTVAGLNLTGSITVNAPNGYELSVLSGSAFVGSPSLTLAQTNGNVPSTLIFIRLKSGLTQGSYNGNVTVVTSSAATKTIALTGLISPMPGLSVTTNSLSGFSYGVGAGPSPIQSFYASGTGLTSYIIVSAPTNFEISADTDNAFTASSQLILPQSGISTPVYVRLKTGLPIGSYNENIVVSSTGMTSQTIALIGNVWPTTGVFSSLSNHITIYRLADNIIVDGLEAGDIVQVYNMIGSKLFATRSSGTTTSIPLPKGKVYILQTPKGTCRVAF